MTWGWHAAFLLKNSRVRLQVGCNFVQKKDMLHTHGISFIMPWACSVKTIIVYTPKSGISGTIRKPFSRATSPQKCSQPFVIATKRAAIDKLY